MRAKPQHMAGQPVQFGQDHPDVIGAGRRFQIQQLLDCFAISQPVGDRGYVIHAVDVGIEHRVSAVFRDFFHAAMQIADDTLGAENFFTVESQDDAQHAVGRGMLRAHVDDELIGIEEGLVGITEFQVRNVFRRVRHQDYWPLSIPRLICTHSLSCWMMP